MTVCVCLSVVSHTTGGLSRRYLNTIQVCNYVTVSLSNYINFCTKIIAFVGAACKVWRLSAVMV